MSCFNKAAVTAREQVEQAVYREILCVPALQLAVTKNGTFVQLCIMGLDE